MSEPNVDLALTVRDLVEERLERLEARWPGVSRDDMFAWAGEITAQLMRELQRVPIEDQALAVGSVIVTLAMLLFDQGDDTQMARHGAP